MEQEETTLALDPSLECEPVVSQVHDILGPTRQFGHGEIRQPLFLLLGRLRLSFLATTNHSEQQTSDPSHVRILPSSSRDFPFVPLHIRNNRFLVARNGSVPACHTDCT